MSAPKTLRQAAADMVLASDDGTEYEHNNGCQGEPECPACWVEGIRQLFADFPEQAAAVFSQTRVAEAIAGHDVRYISRDGFPRWFCPCGEWETDDVMLVVHGHASHLAALVMAAGVFRDEATVKAEAIRELAQKQRQYAADMTTKDGKWECVQAADWLDEQADAIDPALDIDPTKAAVDVIAREVTEQMLDPLDLGDLWSDYPEIGEDDWRDVTARVRARAEAAKPDVETYKVAYAHLQGRAEAWAAENDPA
jgi:hypothetical protein